MKKMLLRNATLIAQLSGLDNREHLELEINVSRRLLCPLDFKVS